MIASLKRIKIALNTMLKSLWLFSLLLIFSHGYSQVYTFSGIVSDEDGQTIGDVQCYAGKSSRILAKSEANGKFEFRYSPAIGDTLKFDHVAFENATIVVTKRMIKSAKNNKININVILPFRVLDVFEVRANVPDTVFGTQDYSVSDFEFDTDNRLILLTYDKVLEKGSVVRLLSDDKEVIDFKHVPGEAIELRKDFRDNVHLICEEQVYLIRVEQNRLNLYLEDKDYVFKHVLPVVDSIDNYIYFSNYSDLYPAFDYLEFNRADSTYKPIITVEDDLMMELYRSEYKYVDVRTKLWAHNKEIETGVDKEVWVGATVFTNSIYYEALYAPLFKTGHDSILVFDHYKNYLFKYQPQVGFVDSVRIAYHKQARKSGWEQPLIQDKITLKIYGLFLINGFTYLSEIDLRTGVIKKSFKLTYKYVENIQLIDGYVYYIYRPFESIQKKYLYRERLN